MEKLNNDGHRKRLRQKFIRAGLNSLNDYEIVELLLTLGTPRKDCKQQAKEAIDRFKTLRGVLEAPSEQLQTIKGIGPTNIFGFKFVHEVAKEFLKEKIPDKKPFKTSKEVFDYLFYSMRDLKKEVFKVIHLNTQNKLIRIEDVFEGSLTTSAIYPREIIKNAISNNSAAMIFIHNHPSGEPKPSESDKDITRKLIFSCMIMEIKILDHLIIGDNRYFSFADEGLIKEYEFDFKTEKFG